MRRLPLRWKILLYWSALILVLIGAMLGYVNYQAVRFVNERIATDLEQGRERITSAEDERLADLRLTAQLVASFPDLKALLSTDLATIHDFLLSYHLEHKLSELLIVLDPLGRVVARTDTQEPEALLDAETRWIRLSLARQATTGVLVTRRGVYNAAAVPTVAGGTLFGFVIAGASIDNAFARTLRDASQSDVIVVSDRILGSTLPGSNLPWRSRHDWELATIGARRTVKIAGETYLAGTTPLGPDGGPLVVCLRSRDRALAPYRRIQFALLVIGFFAAIAGVSGSALLARSITAPVARFVEGTKQVAAGNLNFRIEVRRGDELGVLAQAFNSMVRGLRERAEMRKFVSQSTVEMIQAEAQSESSAGERKLVTIFFSDMRRFTSISERLPPEEVVKILNSFIGLQAEKVKQFGGDIDKYVGDAVVAIFSGDHMALNAVRCAVEIRQALDAYNATRMADEPLQVGIGIVTGEVILGTIGSEDRLDFTMVGSNVNLCARLCSVAGAGEILLDESTHLLVRDVVTAERLVPVQIKGFSAPVPVYRVTMG